MNIKPLTTQAHQWEEIDTRVPPKYWPDHKTMFSFGNYLFKSGVCFTQED